MSYSRLGVVQAKLGKPKEGLRFHQLALDILEKIFSHNHSAIANVRKKLESSFVELEQYAESLKQGQLLLDRWIADHGGRNDGIKLYTKVANSLNHLGHHQQALEIFEKVLELGKEFGEFSPTYAQT